MAAQRSRRSQHNSAALMFAAAALLSACAMFPPGEDDKGVEMKRQATPVLAALVNYHKEHGEYPRSLHELVPKFISRIPFGPNLEFNHKAGILGFVYEPSWPEINNVSCIAAPGDVQWTCTGGR